MTPIAALSDEELADLSWSLGDEGRAALDELERRARAEAAPSVEYDDPSDWLADRMADAWERGRDRVAERAR